MLFIIGTCGNQDQNAGILYSFERSIQILAPTIDILVLKFKEMYGGACYLQMKVLINEKRTKINVKFNGKMLQE